MTGFSRRCADSNLPNRELAQGVQPTDWGGALRSLASILPDDTPSVLVIDELPHLIDVVPAFEGILQKAWDTQLSRKPVLMILVGSDLAMMEALN